MWETKALHVPLSKVGKNIEGCGLPHLAKNERDMGHPTILGRDKAKALLVRCFLPSPTTSPRFLEEKRKSTRSSLLVPRRQHGLKKGCFGFFVHYRGVHIAEAGFAQH